MKSFLFPALQTAFVLLIAFSFYAASWFGDEYVLRAEPYDPFDPFLGEYVLLQYPDLQPGSEIETGEVFFTLAEGEDGYAVIDRIDNKSFFGAIHGSYYRGELVTAPSLEQYYVEQGTGPGLEEAEELALTVDVSPWGTIRPTFLEAREE